MRAANWKDYELIDTGSGERLERWGDILLIRPDPQIIWKSEKKDPRWRSAHARYKRSSTGGGKWEVYKKLPDVWKITRGDARVYGSGRDGHARRCLQGHGAVGARKRSGIEFGRAPGALACR